MRPAAQATSGQDQPRVALVHDWLTGMRGGEKVLEAIADLYPDAPLYCLVHAPGQVSASIEHHRIRTSFVQRFPAATRHYRQFLPLFPAAVKLFDLDAFDLVISTSHCAVKSVIRPGRALHISYCHSPMRYAWDQFGEYFGPAQVGITRSRLLRPVMAGLARWDRETAGRVDSYVANSRYVAERIRRYYNRESTVVYPPVDTAFYRPDDNRHAARSGFLIVSALVPYKRLDIAIDACRRLAVPLTIIGTGPERARLEAMSGPDVRFQGWLSDEDVRELYRQSAAVLLPGVEDFGMVPVEAQACGSPVVALGEGGAAETVLDGHTGVLVTDASVDAFTDGLSRVRSLAVDPGALRQHALSFSRERFTAGFRAAVAATRSARPGEAASREDTQAGREDKQADREDKQAGREDKQAGREDKQ
jgi:glycosyltransferase involved in cell wall biosynthesis